MSKLKSILKSLNPFFMEVDRTGFVYRNEGKLIRKNIEQLWYRRCVEQMDTATPEFSKYPSRLMGLLKLNIHNVPFQWIVVEDIKNNWNLPVFSHSILSHKIQELTRVEYNENEGQTFQNILQVQKTFWCRLAQNPRRFQLTEVKEVDTRQTAEIRAEFDFGNVTIERITYDRHMSLLPDGEAINKTYPELQSIHQIMSVDWACLSLLCDAFTHGADTRPSIHPQLASYKIAIFIKNRATVSDYDDVVEDLMMRLRDYDTILVDSQEMADAFLIPYTIIIDDRLEESCLVEVRSLSASIGTAVEIEDISEYFQYRLQ